jgi:hypothetical protein
VSRSKRLSGVANAAPVVFAWPSAPQVHLVQALVFLLLIPDVIPNHFLIPTHRGHEVSPRPEMLPYEVLLPLPVHPRQMDSALALDKPHHLRHRIFGRNRDHDVHVVWQQMTFLDPAFLLFGQLSKHFSQMLSQCPVQRLPATLRDETTWYFALPFRVA